MKVMLIDDHPMVLTALQTVIHTLDAGTVVLKAAGSDEALDRLATEQGVELVLLDLMLGRAVDGFALLADLRQLHPGLPVVVVSAVDQLADMVRVIDMGAMGFVPKCASAPELFEALSLVLAGGVYIPPALLQLAHEPGRNLAEAAAAADSATAAQAELALQRQRAGQLARAATQALGNAALHDGAVLRPMAAEPAAASSYAAEPAAASSYAAEPAAASSDAAGPVATAPATGQAPGQPALQERAWLAAMGLTPRQSDVLALLLKGLPNKLIARELNLSVDTVKDHVAAVLRALGVNSRTQAVVAVGRLVQTSGIPALRPG